MSELWVDVQRRAKVPDPIRAARAYRTPELGPRILFFSGGTALRGTSRYLKTLTHNSIHLITPFDSGGSSRSLRDAFSMLSIGDLRNRLLALADESTRGNPETYRLLAHRFSTEGSGRQLGDELSSLVSGEHPLIADVPDPLRKLIQNHLKKLVERLPAEFELAGANVGNLVLAGGYLAHERDIQSVLFLFSRLLETRGIVHPTSTEDRHLRLLLESGEVLNGQHRFARTSSGTRVKELQLISHLENGDIIEVPACEKALKWVRRSDLICYPMGSFYSSLLCNLLPRGIPTAIVEAACPKVYVPNLGQDPEQSGMTLFDTVQRINDTVRQEAPHATQAQILEYILLDTHRGHYGLDLDLPRLKKLGIKILDLPLCDSPHHVSPAKLSEALISLC